MTLTFVVLVLLLTCSAFFSAAETAYTSLSEMQIRSFSTMAGRRAKAAARICDRPDTVLSVLLIGNNLMNIIISVVATRLTILLFGSAFLGVMTAILTLTILIFGEITPKQLAIAHNESLILFSAPLILFLAVVLKPVAGVVNAFSGLLGRLLGGRKSTKITRDGIAALVNHAASVGVLKKLKSQIMRNTIRFGDAVAHDIMTHRKKIFSLPAHSTISEVREKMFAACYARVPIYTQDSERIVGIVLLKSVLRHSGNGDVTLRELSMPPMFVPENRPIDDLFTQFRREMRNMAIVLDEYGGLSGVVTLEDVIEEVLGDLHDEDEMTKRSAIQSLGADNYLILGDTQIYQLNDELNINLPRKRTMHTLGGYLTGLLGRLATTDDTLDTPVGQFRIMSVADQRIVTVRFTRKR